MEEGASIRIDPGLPGGREIPGWCDPERTYPGPVDDFVSAFEVTGIDIEVAKDQRDEPEWKAAEILLPIMTVVGDGSLSVSLNIIASIIFERYVRPYIDRESARYGRDEPTVTYEIFDETTKQADGSITRTRIVNVSQPASSGLEELKRYIDRM